jgi:ribose transport system substrate-binding protein
MPADDSSYPRSDFLRRAAALGIGLPLAGGTLAEAAAAGALSPSAARGADVLDAIRRGTNLHSMDANNNDFWISFRQGALEACKALGVETKLAVSDYNAAKQRSQFENAKTQGVNTVTMTATDEAGSASLIRILTNAGILAVNFNSNAPWSTPLDVSDRYVQYLCVSNLDGGYAMAKSLFQRMGGKGNLVHLQGILGLSHDTDRTIGVNKALKEFPRIKLVARQSGEYTRVKAQQVMEDILTRIPQVDGVFCQNDDMAIGVVNTLKQRGKKALVAGVDGIAEWLDLIESGEPMAYGTWAFHPRYGSALLAVTAFDAYNGWKPSVPERFMGYGSVIIDTQKAARLYNQIVFAKKSPWDYRRMSRVLHPNDFDMQMPVFPRHPNVFWQTRTKEKPKGYRLPAAYANNAEFTRIRKRYAQHFKRNPLAPVLAASRYGKWIAG